MKEFLVMNRDQVLPAHKPIEMDRQGCRKRGYVVACYDYPGHSWGNEELKISKFVRVIADVDESVFDATGGLRKEWRDDFDYEVLSANAAQGRYTVRVFEKNTGASGQNDLTASKVESYLIGWGCIDISFTTNSCTFTFALWGAVRSPEFWDVPLIGTKANFSLVSYNSTSGVGRVQIEVTDGNIKPQQVAQKIQERGGTILSNDWPVVVFEIERSDILTRFRADLKQKAERLYMMQQHRFNTETCDAAVANGGVIELDKAQFIAAIRNMQAE